MKIEIPIFKEFIECNISGSFLVNPYWLEHLLNLFYQGYIGEVQEEIWNTQNNNCKTIEDTAYGIIGKEFDKKHISLPEGFKEGTCKCGDTYGYCGADIGYCVKCLDKMEDLKDSNGDV